MSKFPDDVATAERLTNGDPEILNTPKFSPEEKPDISYLFGGEKKPPKKKKDKEDRKSFGPSNPQRKITHPRFRGSSDHEVRIRTNQYSGSSLPSTPENTNVRNYDCPVCSFTSTRVNVLISHVRSHKSSGYESPLRPRASLPPKASRTHSGNSLESPKRKYVRKTKSMSAKASSNDKSPGETNKRKYSKNIDNKIVKKKKTDPELREKLLADWDIGSSDEEINTESFNSPKEELEKLNENNKEELETEKLKENNKEELEPEKLKDNLTEAENAPKNNENNLIKLNDKDEKSKFSCFDFDEDEPEPPVTIPVRKLGRVFGEKTSLKKEIIKEFNKSQELENKRDEMNKLNDDNKLLEEMNKEADDIDNLVAKISKTTSLNSPKKKLEEEEELSFKSGTSDTLILSRSESDLKSEASGLSEGPELLGAVASESDNLSSKNDQDQEIPMEVDNKEEELEILEIIETEEIEAEKSAEDEKVPLKNSPELEKKSKIMRYSDLERVTIEEEETLPVRSTIGQKSGNLSMGWSQLNEIIGSSLEKNSETPAPVKRGRGRPPKAKNLNSLVKEEVKEVGPKIKEYERKTSQSESDTERSYSGRRRKPNKKYLEDAYSSPSSSSGFAFRTDDSQSEEEKKEVEKPVVVKRKRGRPLGWKKNKNNKVSEVREPSVEFELSETLDSVSEEITEAVEVKERVIDPVDSLEGFEEVKVDKEDKEGRVHLTNLTSAVEIRSVLKEDLVEIDIEDQIGPVAPEATPVDDYNESQTQDQVDRAKLMNDLEDQDDDASGFSEKVEILPPKKSQIKKFELSQIDESQIDLENEIKKHVDEEAGLGEKPKIEGEGMEDEGEEEDVITETFEIIEDKSEDNSGQDGAVIDNGEDMEKIDKGEEEIERIDKVEEEMEKIEEKMEKMEKIEEDGENVGNIDKEIENIDNIEENREKIGKIEDQIEEEMVKIEENKEKIDKIEEEMVKIEKESVKIEEERKIINKIEEENEKIDNIEEEMEKMEEEIEKIDKMEEEIKTIDKIEEEMEKMDKIEEEIEKMNKIEDETIETVETIETIETIETVETIDNSELIEKSSELIENNSEKLNEDSEKLLIENNSENLIENSENFIENSEPKNEPIKLTEEIINPPEIEKPIELTTEILEPEENNSINPLEADKESTIPVKKREKPRIIENVQLKEPMHILKSKLLEKPKGKHKLDDHRLGSKAKIIKLDPSIKRKGGMSYGQKIQVLKAADANDKLQIGQPETVETISIAEGQKLIQSSNLEGMELDINSMPFVLSEDLTPDSIEQMPMVISSIMPTSSGLRAAAQSLPRAAPALAPITSDIETITVDASPKKKASPAILKTKPKAKPTITSIKTLSSPVGGIKSLKFQNTKTSPMVSQKNTPSKYVIVQAGAGGQQMRYMIQGKPTTKVAKVAAPLGNKPSTNPQIVSQGGKVVILTSPQSGQAKVVPFKNSLIKGQVKMPKIDSPTTSKSPKIVTSLLGSKSIVGSPKTILSPKPGQVYTPVNKLLNQKFKSNLLPGTSKTILPMPGKITGVVPGKGTVLTPITGQQVKAIAAKSPGKPGPKVTYQLQKGLPMVAKMQKIPISPAGSPVRNSKPTGIVMTQKTPLPTKKLIRPAGPPGTGMPMGSPVQGVDKIVKSPRGRGRTKPEIKPQVKSLPKIKSKEFTGQLAPGSPGQPGQPGPSNSLPVPGLVPTATAGPSVAATENLEVLEQKEEKAAPQIMALPTESSDGTQTYVLVTIDDQGQIQPLDNNTLMSLEGTIQNPDGTRTLYIDPASLGEGNLDNIVLQFDNSAPPGPPAGASSSSDFVRQVPTTNQDILAAALANTDFQQEILPETTVGSLTAGLTATSLINQTILQSTIIPTSEPISSPSVLETSLTLNQPIMTPLEVPTSLPIQVDAVAAHSAPNLEMPITMTNPAITYIQSELPGNSMPDIGEVEAPVASAENYLVLPSSEGQNYAVSMAENITIDSTAPTPSMPIIDDGFSDDVKGQQGQVFEEAAQEQSGEVRDMPIVADETSMEVDHVESEVQAPVEETLEKIQEVQQEQVPEACGLGSIEPTVEEAVQEQVQEVQESLDNQIQGEFQQDIQVQEINQQVSHPDIPLIETFHLSTYINFSYIYIYYIYVYIKNIPKIHVGTQMKALDESLDNCNIKMSLYLKKRQYLRNDCKINYKPESKEELMEVEESEPSQSYEPSSEIPTQSKSQSTEASPVAYEEAMVEESEPPTQSYDDVKAEATQSYNVPTQSFSEDPARIDDPDFPTQSYEVEKPDNVDGDGIIETDGELSQEGNIPSQSNDIDGIGTSFMGDDRNSCNIAGTASGTGANFNEDETASSSYVPETPETQERDQDQESAISTSSYEIPTCEEINIASSSVIPDTSVDAEHTSIHNNGVPEIPTSSYNLNPDSSSGGSIDAVPSSSYEDNQVESVVEQNVSTSYQVPISMPGLEGNAGFVSESTDQADQPTSYYARHTEDTSEATQSYFVPEGPSPSYQPQTASPSYYEPPPESEATQSYYSQDLEQRTADVEQSASQSYYQESTTSSSSGSTLTSSSATTTAAATTTNDEELRLGQVGEATPTYSTERYPVDYNIDNSSPIDRHDLVESSVSATPQPTER
ncbi:GSCOCG00009075001-RA-CDS [Cotesia congregata]|nr:GSCOCG00009075001-RA-CDS [Cotesia congregata]